MSITVVPFPVQKVPKFPCFFHLQDFALLLNPLGPKQNQQKSLFQVSRQQILEKLKNLIVWPLFQHISHESRGNVGFVLLKVLVQEVEQVIQFEVKVELFDGLLALYLKLVVLPYLAKQAFQNIGIDVPVFILISVGKIFVFFLLN